MSAEFGSDPWLDARLRDVPVPPGLMARLEAIASTPDNELDEIVRDVPTPPDLLPRLSRVSRLPRRYVPWRELSLAAAVLIAVGLGLLSTRTGSVTRSTGDGSKFVGRGSAIGKPSADSQRGLAADKAAAPSPVKLPFDDPRLSEKWHLRDAPRPPAVVAKVDRPAPPSVAVAASKTKEAAPVVVGEHDGILTAPNASDRLPRLETVNRTLSRGLAPTLVPGYDLLYQLRMGERPFVSPESDPALASSPVPLIRDTASYALTRDAIAAGRLPPADDVRIEDFLASLNDLLPPSKGPMALYLEGGPAPFGDPGLQLMQVGLRAGGAPGPDPATGAPRIVARGATLTVAFNPKVVQAYRLVGHATSTLTGPAAAAVTKVDLSAGAELAGLFELWLKPAGGDDVATVDFTWHDPAGGARHHVGGRIRRPQFAKSFVESAGSLQALALAAETARALRLHAAPGRGLVRVLELAPQVQPDLRSRESFGQLIQLVAQAEKVRANPGAGARRAAADSQP